MLIEDQNPFNKSITVSVLGKPNAGKSSLINNFLGFDLSIVSAKPQTTRNRFKCIVNIDKTEIVFVDTPGIHKSMQEINKRMNGQARFGSNGADINLLLIDTTEELDTEINDFFKNFEVELGETWLVFTKTDITKKNAVEFLSAFNKAKEKYKNLTRYFAVSSKTDSNIHELTTELLNIAPESPHHYPDGSVSDKNMRFFAAEYIRETAFHTLKEELPYEIAVTIDEFHEVRNAANPNQRESKIQATILVNRPSQRAIVVGAKGSVIKKLGIESRRKIAAMTGGPVHLNLHVKVSPKWFKNNYVLDEIGLPRVQDSARVWRQK